MMMHNTYSGCSSIISFRTSLRFNDYTYNTCYYPNESCPSKYCSCCSSFNVNSSRLLVPMNLNPSVLYGLRQSTLIQLPPSRRIVLGSSDRYCYRVSNFDVGLCCCGESCSNKAEQVVGSCKEKCCVEKKRSVGFDGGLGRSCKESRNAAGVYNSRGRLSRRGRDFRCNALGDAEAMLSLLSEESVEECVLVRGRRKGSSKEGGVVREINVASEKSKDRKNCARLGNSGSESKKEDFSRVHVKEEEYKRREESLQVDEDRRSKRRESTSSYYSVLDSDEFDSDAEVDEEQERFAEELSSSQRKNSGKTGSVVVNEVNKQELKRYSDEKDQEFISSRHQDVRVGSSAEWDCRKKSEKKLTEVSTEGSNVEESILRRTKVSQANESASVVASSLKGNLTHREEESTSHVGSHKQSRSSVKRDKRSNEHSRLSGRHEHLTSGVNSHAYSRSNVRTDSQASDYLISGRRQEQSLSDTGFRRQPTSQINTVNQVRESEYTKSSQQHEQRIQFDRQNAQTTASAWRRSMQTGEGAMVVGQAVQETECEHCKTCGRSMRENKMETDIGQHVSLSEITDNSRWTTSEQSQSEGRRREQDIGSSSMQASVEVDFEQQDQPYSTSQLDARVSAGQFSETVDTDYSYVQNTRMSQQQSETQMKKFNETSTTSTSGDSVESLHQKSTGEAVVEPSFSNVFQTETSASQVHSVSDRHSETNRRLYDEQSYSTSVVKSVKESVEKQKLVDETIVLTRYRTEVQPPVLQAGLSGNFSGEANSSQPTAPLISQSGVQQLNVVQLSNEFQLPVVSSSYQLRESKSSDGEPSSIFARKDSRRLTEVDSGTASIEPQAGRPPSSADANDSVIMSSSGAFYSAQRLQESSTQIVGEFVEKMRQESSTQIVGEFSQKLRQESSTQIVGEFSQKMRQESSTSETNMEELLQLSDGQILKGPSQIDSNSTRIVNEDPSHSSGVSATTYELWGMKDQPLEEASESESLEGATSESMIARRTGKSLWNIAGGIFRLRWGSSSATQKSPVKADQQSSPTDSTSGETWFSGNELEEGTGDSMIREEVPMPEEPTSSVQFLPRKSNSRSRKKGREKTKPQSMPQEPASADQPLLRRSTRGRSDRGKTGHESIVQDSTSQQPLQGIPTIKSQEGDLRIMSSDDKLSPIELDVSTSSSTAEGGSLSAGMSIGANIGLSITQQTAVFSPQDLSLPSARRLRRSDAIEEIEQGDSLLEGLITGANIDLNMSQQTSASSPQGLPIPSARRFRRTDALKETKEGSSVSGSVSVGAETNLNMSQQTTVSSPQDIAVSSGRRLRRTDAFEEAEESEERIISMSKERVSNPPHSLVPSASEQSGVLVPENADTESRQRKFQRTDKLIIDRFDEWEDAYRRDSEQRKVDEIFMREALAEAIKAADSWEVPVGAVLVQNGNIIARGYNLVEELRDSTAHAEMICIREASNVLRTWRLSDTTLYVTLEPCPMCAGAILQARVGTLVWGAPNKLLGADGSWIRLFPEGGEGQERSEVVEKPAPPKHPFHPNMKIRRGVLESECAQAMQQFFQLRRRKEKEKEKKDEEGQPSCLPVPHPPSKLLHKMFHITFCM